MADTFFYEPLLSENDKTFLLSENTARHCIQVLRMKTGDAIELTNGKGFLFNANIMRIEKKECTVKINYHNFFPQQKNKISIAISLLKNTERFEWFLEKAVELGINEIMPLICKRTLRGNFRKDRMENIIVSAMLQSRQYYLPKLNDAVLFEKYISSSFDETKLIAYCKEDNKKKLEEITYAGNTEILIGPEGDFTNEEIALAIKNNYLPISLGDTRLRTETAGVAVAVLLKNLTK